MSKEILLRVGSVDEEFINRRKELKEALSLVKMGQSCVFIAPRRYGKTSLMLKVAEELREEFFIAYVDVNVCTSVRDLGEHILNAVYSAVGVKSFVHRAKNRIGELFKSIRELRIKLGNIEFELGLELLQEREDIAFFREVIDLPEKFASRTGKRFLVIYDEFSEVYQLEKKIPDIIRSKVQMHKNCVYMFAGSQESMMRRFFTYHTGAFYRFARVFILDFLEEGDVREYIRKKIKSAGLKYYEEGENEVVKLTKGHPYYLKKLLQTIILVCKDFSKECVVESVLRLLEEEKHYFETLLYHLKEKKYRGEIVRLLAMGESPYSALKGTLSSQHVNQILRDLEMEGVVRRRNRGAYELTDPLLALYLSAP